ncbi:MAG: GTP-binding protein [Planctomycetota bacterium]
MTRFALLGGFLGAGKTTLIGEIARRYVAAGKTVGILTNDQADNLVDTQNLRAQGFAVGEVAGACFCCSFDEMVDVADRLEQETAPDLLLAEPVGSCTDLVATIVLPLEQRFGEKFVLAPFGVLLKPSHGKRILGQSDRRSGFSPQAEYIFRKQLEEADYLIIGRGDQLGADEVDLLRGRLEEVAPGVPVVVCSPRSGLGVDEVMGYIESPMQAGKRLLEIDYDTYAMGEAELGWVNLSAVVQSEMSLDSNAYAADLVREIGKRILAEEDAVIAHVKVSVSANGQHAVANLVDNEATVETGLHAEHEVRGTLEVVINARVAMDPVVLQSHCSDALDHIAMQSALSVESSNARSLRPGRPVPTHRVLAS